MRQVGRLEKIWPHAADRPGARTCGGVRAGTYRFSLVAFVTFGALAIETTSL